MAKVGIIGGGISGLSAAHFLTKFGSGLIREITLFEGSAQTGGWIRTTRTSDGAVFEHGPRSLRAIGQPAQTTLEMVEDLGLTSSVISLSRTHPAARNRFVFAKDRLCPLPNSPLDLLRLKPPFSQRLYGPLLKEIFVPPGKLPDESVYQFFQRRFGNQIAQHAVEPMCIGIFAGDAKKLSIRSCFPALFEMEQKSGSVLRSMFIAGKSDQGKSDLSAKATREKWSVWSMREGLQSLSAKLEEELQKQAQPAVRIRKNSPVTELHLEPSGQQRIVSDSEEERVDHVISAVAATDLAGLLRGDEAFVQSLRANLQSIHAVDVAVVNFEFAGNLITTPAFGYLIGPQENSPILGVIFDSCLFPEHGPRSTAPTTRLTCMLGGDFMSKHFARPEQRSENAMVRTALGCLGEQLGITQSPTRTIFSFHKRCIPQYYVGHWKTVADIRRRIEDQKLPLGLIGSSFDGVGINDCVHSGKLSAQSLLAKLAR